MARDFVTGRWKWSTIVCFDDDCDEVDDFERKLPVYMDVSSGARILWKSLSRRGNSDLNAHTHENRSSKL